MKPIARPACSSAFADERREIEAGTNRERVANGFVGLEFSGRLGFARWGILISDGDDYYYRLNEQIPLGKSDSTYNDDKSAKNKNGPEFRIHFQKLRTFTASAILAPSLL